jgi:hypothetical protein
VLFLRNTHSNWVLDPAKMNRAVHVFRPAPSVEDLCMTASGMVGASPRLDSLLPALARAYAAVYAEQQRSDFFGLRDFYATVRALAHELHSDAPAAIGKSLVQQGDAPLVRAVLRNFSGRPPAETHAVLQRFLREAGSSSVGASTRSSSSSGSGSRSSSTVLPSTESLIRENLQCQSSRSTEDAAVVASAQGAQLARHLMLLTSCSAAASLGLLFDRGLLQLGRAEVIFGSDFARDRGRDSVCSALQRVRHCMASGVPVVLLHCDALHESLYGECCTNLWSVYTSYFLSVTRWFKTKLGVVVEHYRCPVITCVQ